MLEPLLGSKTAENVLVYILSRERGYASEIALTDTEVAALPLLARGASLRFLLTRAHDWVHTPADALVTRKDPLPFLNRLRRYKGADAASLFAIA